MSVLKIYVAGPYTASTPALVLDNVHAALDAGIEIIRRGHVPFIPHLTHWIEKRNERETERHGFRLVYEDYLRLDMVWLAECDAVLYLGSSPGADRELAVAEGRGLTVYRAVEDIPERPV